MRADPGADTATRRAIRAASRDLETDDDLDALVERLGDARCVLIGEASHGTSEFYTWRARLSRRLIREKEFSFVAVEGDWPACAELDRYVRARGERAGGVPENGEPPSARHALRAFGRWPTWMWANWEVVAFSEWLRSYNDARASAARVGFHGLDVYSLWESLGAVVDYLERHDPEALPAARRAFRCFEPYRNDAHAYARANAFVPSSCEDEVVALLGETRRRAADRTGREDDDARFGAEQNSRVLVGAERYYRAMIRGGPESWNVRDRHMTDTLERLLEHHDPGAKAIVWEHNTHVGDARATDMADAGMVNVGQLARERFGAERVALVGFGAHRGTVIAGRYWGAPRDVMTVPRAREGSWEAAFHEAVGGDCVVLDLAADDAFAARRGHRAIGVVYDPGRERYGNYVPTELASRYDAFVYLERGDALHPLGPDSGASERSRMPETYPWGV